MQDCAAYFAATGRRISYEYTLLRDVNEEVKHAQQLGRLLKAYDMASHVNVIPWNPVDESEFQRPAKARVMAFKAALEEEGVAVSVRSTRGLEAAAACGQLRNRHQKEPMKEFQLPA